MSRSIFHHTFFTFFLLTSLIPLFSVCQSLTSHVYNWKDIKIEKKDSGEDVRPVLSGSSRDLENLEIYDVSGKAGNTSFISNDQEQLIIIYDGKVNLTLNYESRVTGPGSIAWIAAGDKLNLANVDNTSSSYYVLKFKSRLPINKERGKKSGSVIIDWKDVVAKPTDKGMRREFFDLPTGMFERFEMHVTTLNKKDEISHPPHTHRAEEIVLLLNGQVEMQIGDQFTKGDPGALIFLASESSHALKNIGNEPCTYFAFQWQETK